MCDHSVAMIGITPPGTGPSGGTGMLRRMRRGGSGARGCATLYGPVGAREGRAQRGWLGHEGLARTLIRSRPYLTDSVLPLTSSRNFQLDRSNPSHRCASQKTSPYRFVKRVIVGTRTEKNAGSEWIKESAP